MSVKSAMRVLEVLELLADYSEGLSTKEVSEKLAFPQSSTFNILQTMFSEGYLVQTTGKKYKLGSRLIRIGTSALNAFDLHKDARPYLQQLMEEVQETVFMAGLSEHEIVYLAKVDNNRSIKTSAEIGSRKPLYCTGLGKAFLSFIPFEQRHSLLKDVELEAITKKTVTDRDLLNKQLDYFRNIGYAIDDEENEEGLYCYAAPIYNATGEVTAAISTAGPKERITKNGTEVVSKLLNTSRSISENLGFFRK